MRKKSIQLQYFVPLFTGKKQNNLSCNLPLNYDDGFLNVLSKLNFSISMMNMSPKRKQVITSSIIDMYACTQLLLISLRDNTKLKTFSEISDFEINDNILELAL